MKTVALTLGIVILTGLYSLAMAPNAAIEWEATEHDFGKVSKNEPVTYEFSFKNPSMLPLVIMNVKTSCGCTVPEYPRKPIMAGGEGTITVTYDAKVSGYFSKTVTVFTNTADKFTELYIKGEVQE